MTPTLGSSEPRSFKVHQDFDLDDTYPGILRDKLIHEDSLTSGYSHAKCSHSTQIARQNTDHEDGIVSGKTMNVYIPLYAPESDMNVFSKPSVINIQPLVWEYNKVHALHIQYGAISLHSAQEYCITGCSIARYITVQEITMWIQIGKCTLLHTSA